MKHNIKPKKQMIVESDKLMSFKFPKEFRDSLRLMSKLYGKDMSLIIIEAVYQYQNSNNIEKV